MSRVVLCWLNVRHPPARSELREGEPFLIGRNHGFDRGLAPEEARITLNDGRVTVETTNPRGQPTLNGKPVGRSFVLHPDTVLHFGDHDRWSFFIGEGRPVPVFEPRSPREAEIFQALARAPGDHELRAVYADWLEENGHAAEAEVLRIERRLWRDTGHYDRREQDRLGYRSKKRAETLPLAWRQVATRPRIRGCARPDCPRAWDRLSPRETSGVRTCGVCTKDVWFGEDVTRAAWHLRQDQPAVLDVAAARGPHWLSSMPPSTEEPLFDLPLFARPYSGSSVSVLLGWLGLEMPPPDAPLPLVLEPQRPHPIRSVFVRQGHEPGQTLDVHTFRDIHGHPTGELRLAFDGDGAGVEAWLRSHFGVPFVRGEYRVYGRWLFRSRDGGFTLWWYRSLPRWATDVDPEITFAFLRELLEVLSSTLDFEAAKDLASRPPRRSGVIPSGVGDNDTDSFYLTFSPTIDAIEVAELLGVEDPSSWDDPHEMHWPLFGKRDHWWNTRHELRWIMLGRPPKSQGERWWDIDAWLETRPRDVEKLTRRDRVRGLSFELTRQKPRK